MNVRRTKKKYLALAVLASLAVPSGSVGAIVTAESTLPGNTMTVVEARVDEPVVVVSGRPLAAVLTQGALYAGAADAADYRGNGLNSISTTAVQVRNDGTATAVVDVLKDLPGVNIPAAGGEFRLYFYLETTELGYSVLDGSGAFVDNPAGATFDLVPGETKTVNVTLVAFGDTTPTETINPLFDLRFDFSKKE